MYPAIARIIPTLRPDPLDDPAWACELKMDGFRGLADTINARMLSKNLNPLKRFQHLLDALPLFVFSMGRFVRWIAMVGPS
jgi:ATP-dependent DNA ligase